MSEEYVNYPCPYCHTKKLESAATLPYVRGYILVFEYGSKKLLGCKSCVRKQLFKETAKSALIGWFSPKALIANPFLIVYGIIRGTVLGKNTKAVRKELKKAGIADPGENINIIDIGYSLAASMIAADNKIEPQEVRIATKIGQQIFGGFNSEIFNNVLENHKSLPEPAELSLILGEVLDEEGKILVCKYLLAIATADGDFAVEEQELMDVIITNMKLNPSLVYGEKAA